MAEYTDADKTRLAEMLAGGVPWSSVTARSLLEQGVTLPPPPPDPAVMVAEVVRRSPLTIDGAASLRHLFTTDAIEAAAAKVQEVDR